MGLTLGLITCVVDAPGNTELLGDHDRDFDVSLPPPGGEDVDFLAKVYRVQV